MLPNLLRQPKADGAGQRCFSHAMVPWLLRRMAYHTEPGFLNFHDCEERVYKNTVLWAARDGDPVSGDHQPHDLALRTTRTGLLHHAYPPEYGHLLRYMEEQLRMSGNVALRLEHDGSVSQCQVQTDDRAEKDWQAKFTHLVQLWCNYREQVMRKTDEDLAELPLWFAIKVQMQQRRTEQAFGEPHGQKLHC